MDETPSKPPATGGPLMEEIPLTPTQDSRIWTTQPKSFPKEGQNETVAELNKFHNSDQDTTPDIGRVRSVKFAAGTADNETSSETRRTSGGLKYTAGVGQAAFDPNFILTNPNSRFYNARNSIAVHRRRHSQDTDRHHDDEDEEEEDNFDEDLAGQFGGENYHEEELTSASYNNYGFGDFGRSANHNNNNANDDDFR